MAVKVAKLRKPNNLVLLKNKIGYSKVLYPTQ